MGIEEASTSSPPRLRIFNLKADPAFNENVLVVQFNPSQFEEFLSVNYARPQVLGQSHQELQYLSTSNMVIPLELFFLSRDFDTHFKGVEAKRFLHSLCYPTRGADAIVSGAPPRALVVWPGVLSMSTKITQLRVKNQRFNNLGQVVQFTADCTFEEMREVRWTSEDARTFGSQRTAENPGGNQ